MKRRFFANTVVIVGMVLAVASLANAQLSSGLTPPPPRGVPTGAIDFAQADGQPQAPDAFGNHDQWTSIFASQWQPVWEGVGLPVAEYPYVCVNPNDTFSPPQYWAQLNLPNGAEVAYLYVWVKDDDASSDWFLWFTGYEAGTAPFFVDYENDSTSGEPGYVRINLTIDPPVVIHEYEDLNGDGTPYLVATGLTLRASPTPSANTDMCFFGAAVRWTRTITPAPVAATFSDVPLGSFGFQHVEALAYSGITAGCGGGNFCPNDPLTRVQMAVFLAKALGLHWPE